MKVGSLPVLPAIMNVEEGAGQGAAAYCCRYHIIDVEVQVLPAPVLDDLKASQLPDSDRCVHSYISEICRLTLAVPRPVDYRDLCVSRAGGCKVVGNPFDDGFCPYANDGACLHRISHQMRSTSSIALWACRRASSSSSDGSSPMPVKTTVPSCCNNALSAASKVSR